MTNIFYNEKNQTCANCKKNVADYILSSTKSGKRLCYECDPDTKNGPLMIRSPSVGANFSAHMSAKAMRHKKRIARTKKRGVF